MSLYAVVLAGTKGFDAKTNTVVEIVSMDTEKGTAVVKPLDADREVSIYMEDSIACEGVAKVIEPTGNLKVDDKVYEVEYNEETNNVWGFDSNGKEVTVDASFLTQRIEE